jgi:hypothetical protein
LLPEGPEVIEGELADDVPGEGIHVPDRCDEEHRQRAEVGDTEPRERRSEEEG